MKLQGLLIALFLTFSFLVIGCSNKSGETENQTQKIVVDEYIESESEYNHFRDVTITKQVNKIIDILEDANWENAEVNMENAPNYKFRIDNIDNKTNSNDMIYELWISPNQDKVELEVQGEGKYVQLSKKKSAELFEIITERKLSES